MIARTQHCGTHSYSFKPVRYRLMPVAWIEVRVTKHCIEAVCSRGTGHSLKHLRWRLEDEDQSRRIGHDAALCGLVCLKKILRKPLQHATCFVN